jgi:hypothetical protein
MFLKDAFGSAIVTGHGPSVPEAIADAERAVFNAVDRKMG